MPLCPVSCVLCPVSVFTVLACRRHVVTTATLHLFLVRLAAAQSRINGLLTTQRSSQQHTLVPRRFGSSYLNQPQQQNSTSSAHTLLLQQLVVVVLVGHVRKAVCRHFPRPMRHKDARVLQKDQGVSRRVIAIPPPLGGPQAKPCTSRRAGLAITCGPASPSSTRSCPSSSGSCAVMCGNRGRRFNLKA